MEILKPMRSSIHSRARFGPGRIMAEGGVKGKAGFREWEENGARVFEQNQTGFSWESRPMG